MQPLKPEPRTVGEGRPAVRQSLILPRPLTPDTGDMSMWKKWLWTRSTAQQQEPQNHCRVVISDTGRWQCWHLPLDASSLPEMRRSRSLPCSAFESASYKGYGQHAEHGGHPLRHVPMLALARRSGRNNPMLLATV